ncbi:hypothetical protein [Achromobacter mucicolens]|uniref:hypothetical protein n=1 Tax=Achromobacter mucicolens TaxID=1389922 RepID=UPI0015D2B93E|nr:hypothetical protein [Achromobacter mucicolens]MCP2517273.1 hypothetical protein [Achromobacter mucicolens]
MNTIAMSGSVGSAISATWQWLENEIDNPVKPKSNKLFMTTPYVLWRILCAGKVENAVLPCQAYSLERGLAYPIQCIA